MEPIIFDHVALEEEKGKILDSDQFLTFASGIAMKLLEERGEMGLSVIRLLSFNTPCIFTKDRMYILPIAMYPEHATVSNGEILEGLSVAKSTGKTLFSYPLSLASITDDPSKKIAGASYLVRVGEVKEVKIENK